MGMYSTFIEQDIEVLDKEKLIEAVKDLEHNDLISENGEIDFINWTDNKIEGYWYDETIEVLNAISPYVEGWVEFQYEEGYNFQIVFEKGKVYFRRQPSIDWSLAEKTELNNIKKDFIL